MSDICFLGFPSHASQPYATVQTSGLAGLEPPEMGAEYLLTEEPSDLARLTMLDPRHTQFAFGTSGLPSTFDGFALVNHNITSGGQIRILGHINGTSINTPFREVPTSLSFSQNITGGVGDIDEEIDSPDGLAIVPTVTNDVWGATLEFGTPGGVIYPIEDGMAFVLRVRRRYSGAGATDPSTYPHISVNLVEGGSLVRSLGYRAVTDDSAEGQILIFPFSLSDLSDPSGAGVGCEINGSPGWSPSGHQYVTLETARFYWEASTGGWGADTGWFTLDYGDGRPAPLQPNRSFHHFPSNPWTGMEGWTLMIRSDQTRHDPPTQLSGDIPVGAIGIPHSFVQAGVMVAGEAIIPSRGIRRGSTPLSKIQIQEFAATTAAGQSFGSDSYRFKSWEPVDLILTRDEANLLQDQLAFRRGLTNPFYVAMEPGVTQFRQMFSSGWVVLRRLSAPIPYGRYRADGGMLFNVSLELAERL